MEEIKRPATFKIQRNRSSNLYRSISRDIGEKKIPQAIIGSTANIKYSWGFPASLVAQKDDRFGRLRYPEDFKEFCKEIGIPKGG